MCLIVILKKRHKKGYFTLINTETEKVKELVSKLNDCLDGESWDAILNVFGVIILSMVNDQDLKVDAEEREKFLEEWCTKLLTCQYVYNSHKTK